MFDEPPPPRISVTTGQRKAFWAAVDEGRVWVSGLGLGAGEAEITITGDWPGMQDHARHLFYEALENGLIEIDRARIVRR